MGGRHGKKHKGHKPPKNMASAATGNVKASDEPAQADVKETTSDAVENAETIPMRQKWLRRPEPHDVAILGLILAFAVCVVYYLQLVAMLKSNEINREALRTVQRAFVHFSYAVNMRGTADTKTKRVVKWDFMIPVENSGGTQTKRMTMKVNYFVPDNGARLPDNFGYVDYYKDATHVVLPPKGETHAGAITISPDALNLVRTNRAHVYFFGWAIYHDVFKGTAPHITEFCFELENFNPDPYTGEGGPYSYFTACPHHNCTDEECDNEKTPPEWAAAKAGQAN